ncbi:MAG: HAMP domain-containing sensor histidine kinase [Candidatus Thorarchaeota archaeon]
MGEPDKATSRVGILSRINQFLFEPPASIVGSRLRQQARYLSILLVLGIPIFIYAQSTSDIVELPLYFIVSMTYAFAYVLSRTRWYHPAAAITAGISSIVPLGIFAFSSGFLPTDLPRVMIWGTFSILVGAFFLRPRYVVIQYCILFVSLLHIATNQFNMPLLETIEFFLTDALVAGLILIFSFMLHDYSNKSDEQFKTLEKRRWELEVYTQLLRHDIRNDLHALLGSVELAEMLIAINPDNATSQLSTSLKIGGTMVGLLDAFSKSPQVTEMNLVAQIEQVALEAEQVHIGLTIDIASTKRAKDVESASSRLMPMVWMNIFRNAAQHAGPSPHVDVSIFDIEDSIKVTIQDTGPGVSDEAKPWMFVRGNPAESEFHGMGMYLARVIIESHGGTIDLVDGTGCKFEIILPM